MLRHFHLSNGNMFIEELLLYSCNLMFIYIFVSHQIQKRFIVNLGKFRVRTVDKDGIHDKGTVAPEPVVAA